MRIKKIFIKLILKLDHIGIIRIKDEKYLEMQYFIFIGKKLNIDNPETFNEKLQWLKLNNKEKNYTSMVDKYEAKKYVSNIIGSEQIIPTLGIYDKFDNINFENLPNQFVMKCTHDCGSVIICEDKNKLDIKKARIKINKSLKKNYFYNYREWPYKNVEPRIIIEKYMGKNLNDYKIFCFNGKPYFTLVCSNRNGNFKNTNFYDLNWQLLPFTRENHQNCKEAIPKPVEYKKMLEIAKKLSKNIPFVRVDLYEICNKIYFGELTFFPSGGLEGFYPSKWDKTIGNYLSLPFNSKK